MKNTSGTKRWHVGQVDQSGLVNVYDAATGDLIAMVGPLYPDPEQKKRNGALVAFAPEYEEALAKFPDPPIRDFAAIATDKERDAYLQRIAQWRCTYAIAIANARGS